MSRAKERGCETPAPFEVGSPTVQACYLSMCHRYWYNRGASMQAARCPHCRDPHPLVARIGLQSARCPQQAPTWPLLPWGPALSSCGWTVGGCARWMQGGGGQGHSLPL